MKFSTRRTILRLRLDNALRWSAVAAETAALGLILQGMRYTHDRAEVDKKYVSIQKKYELIRQRNERRAQRRSRVQRATHALHA